MIKLLYSISIIVLILAGFLFVLSGIQLTQAAYSHEYTSQNTIIDKFQTMGNIEINIQDKVSPLVERAMEYSLYLNPPIPPEPVLISQPVVNAQPIYRPANVTPKFKLLSISYYISSPEKSVALVSEPGKGDHWIKRGEWVGNFFVQSIEKDSIIYRDGSNLHELAVKAGNVTQFAKEDDIVSPKIVDDINLAKNIPTKENYTQPIQNFLADEYSSPVRSVRPNQKKNIKPSLRTIYTPN